MQRTKQFRADSLTAEKIADVLAHMPSYDRLTKDQARILSELKVDEPAESVDSYLKWVYQVVAVGLGDAEDAVVLLSDMLIPFFVDCPYGRSKAGREWRLTARKKLITGCMSRALERQSRRATEWVTMVQRPQEKGQSPDRAFEDVMQ